MKLPKEYITVGLAVVLMLSACSVAKKYRRPEQQLPAQYRATVSVTADSVMLPWDTFFEDRLLVDLIERALQKNNEVSIAMLNMQQLDLNYKQAKQSLLPALDLNIGASRTWQSKNSLNGSLSQQLVGSSYMDDYIATIGLSWEADIWGKARMQQGVARANYLAQKENISALKTRIITQVAQAYYNLITLDEQLKVAKRNIELGDSTVSMIRLQFKSGQVNSLAVEQAEAQKKTAELLVPLALQNIATQENALSILCGSYPDAIERAASLYMPKDVFPLGVPAQLLSRRPDIKAAEYAVIAANSQTGLARAAMYPAINLTPSIGANAFQFEKWFDLPGSLVKTIGGNITQPIFRRRSLQTAYEVAQLEQQKAAIQFKQSVLTAVGEVSDAMAMSKYATERMQLVEQKTASLSKSAQDALLLYRSGMATYLEVITAQNNALQNELEAISIQRDKWNAITDLYRALGGGAE